MCFPYRCKVMIQAADVDDDVSKKSQPKSSKTLPAVVCAIWRRRIFGIFQGLAGPDLEDCAEFSIAFDDQRENFQKYLGSHTCNQKVSTAFKGKTKKCLIALFQLMMCFSSL